MSFMGSYMMSRVLGKISLEYIRGK
jgi:hypothetical protein